MSLSGAGRTSPPQNPRLSLLDPLPLPLAPAVSPSLLRRSTDHRTAPLPAPPLRPARERERERGREGGRESEAGGGEGSARAPYGPELEQEEEEEEGGGAAEAAGRGRNCSRILLRSAVGRPDLRCALLWTWIIGYHSITRYK